MHCLSPNCQINPTEDVLLTTFICSFLWCIIGPYSASYLTSFLSNDHSSVLTLPCLLPDNLKLFPFVSSYAGFAFFQHILVRWYLLPVDVPFVTYPVWTPSNTLVELLTESFVLRVIALNLLIAHTDCRALYYVLLLIYILTSVSVSSNRCWYTNN